MAGPGYCTRGSRRATENGFEVWKSLKCRKLMRNVRGKVSGRRHENISSELLSFAGNFHDFLCENFLFFSWQAIRKAGLE